MADVQEASSSSAEPSMEEILASIRKIISDDQPADGKDAGAGSDDVIELTQEVKDDGSVMDVNAIPEPPAPPPPMPEPPVIAAPKTEAPKVEAPKPEPKPSSPPIPAATPSLIEDKVAGVAASSLSSLADTVEIERLAAEPQGTSYLGNGSRTLEDMVIELMRPLLKQWLDQNLPATVERLVQKEVERISRRSKD